MNEQSLAGQAAFAPANTADIADAMIAVCRSADRCRPPPRACGRAQSEWSLRASARARLSTMAGRTLRSFRRSRPKCRSKSRARPSPATNRPTFPSTARSILIAAASMAASTASRGRRMPIWAFPPGWTSRPSCLPSRTQPKLLERELAKPGYKPRVIAIGTNTDPYQPIEKEWRIMRQILEVLDKANHPVSIVTKSALILRDHRYPLGDGREEPCSCFAVGDDARPQARRARWSRAPRRRRGGWRRSAHCPRPVSRHR